MKKIILFLLSNVLIINYLYAQNYGVKSLKSENETLQNRLAKIEELLSISENKFEVKSKTPLNNENK